jgi:hypothetical protein
LDQAVNLDPLQGEVLLKCSIALQQQLLVALQAASGLSSSSSGTGGDLWELVLLLEVAVRNCHLWE